MSSFWRKTSENNSESEDDFKAAFVCVTNNINGYLKSAEELTKG
jgi:hypothetical protein